VIREHANAVLTLLQAVPNLTVYDGHVPDEPAFPYAVLYADDGLRGPLALTLTSDQVTMTLQVTSVGATADAARIIADKVSGALLDIRPTVASRACWPIRHESTRPAIEDRDVVIPGTSLHPIYAVDVYRLASLPA